MSPRRASLAVDTSPVVDEENPWLGLLAFREANRRFFFGRDEELDDLFRRVRRETLTVLYAQSGLGKTSLLQAGLFPRLREEGFLPVPIRLDYGEFETGVRADADPVGRQIAQAVAGAIASRNLAGATDPMAAPGPWEYLHDIDFDLPNETGGLLTPVLVFDQLEELFTLGASRRDGGRMVARTTELLGDLIENRVPRALDRAMRAEPSLVDRFTFEQARYRVLLSLREDYLPHLHALRTEVPSIILNNVRLTRFDRRHALDVVERPAAARHLVTREVADAIVHTVAGQDSASDGIAASRPADEPEGSRLEVDPSLLSLFCRQLNGLRLKRGESAISLDLVLSNRESVLRDFYIDSFRDLAAPREGGVKAFVEDFLLTSKGYRDRLTVERANEILVDRYRGSPHDLDTLVDRRLLHVEERGKTPQIELTHDVLAPIALRERAERVHNEELRQAEERRVLETRRAEEDERKAREAAAAAAAELAKARRQQRVTSLLLAVAIAAAGLATWFGLSARQTAQQLKVSKARADTAKTSADSARTVAIRAESMAVKEGDAQKDALVQANQEKTRSTAMLGDFCTYTLTVINRFGDSTVTNNNQSLQQAYNSLLELSDTSADRMIKRSPDGLCPLQLDARVSSISADLLYQLGNTRLSIARGRHGLDASLKLLPHDDSVSVWVATQSLSDLVHALYFDGDYKDAARAARVAWPLAQRVNPATDSASVDRLARIYHYGENALYQLHQVDSAIAWTKRGLDVAIAGEKRRDQLTTGLMYTESQLWLDMSELDSARHDTAQGLTDVTKAIGAAQRRYDVLQSGASKTWLARMRGWGALYAGAVGRNERALEINDSSIADYNALVKAGRNKADTTWIAQGMTAIGNVLVAKARAYLALDRKQDAIASAHAGRDTVAMLIKVQGSFPNLYALGDIQDSLGVIARLAGDRALEDSAYAQEFAVDSVIAYLESASWAQIHRYHDALNHLSNRALQWLDADTAGKDSASRVTRLYGSATIVRHYRDQQVYVSRYFLKQALGSALTSADSNTVNAAQGDSLAVDLGNLAWQDLLLGNGENGVTHAKEGYGLSRKQTYILVNEFNGLVLAGQMDEAKALYAANAGVVENTSNTPFPCAVERDMAELVQRGVATPAQHAFVTQLSAPGRSKCGAQASRSP